MNHAMAMCESLIDGWSSDWKMWRVVAHAWTLLGKEPPDDVAKYTVMAEAIRVKHINAADMAKSFCYRNIPQLNDAMLARRPRERCLIAAMKAIGRGKFGQMVVSVRERDKRHDWNTVK